MVGDLRVYYSSLASPHSIDCRLSRWDVNNYTVTMETWLTKSQLNTIRTHLRPGATGELYKLYDRPIYRDKTWRGDNTIMLSPRDAAESNIKEMRDDTIIFVKNISSSPIRGPSGWINVKIEGHISGNRAL